METQPKLQHMSVAIKPTHNLNFIDREGAGKELGIAYIDLKGGFVNWYMANCLEMIRAKVTNSREKKNQIALSLQ